MCDSYEQMSTEITFMLKGKLIFFRSPLCTKSGTERTKNGIKTVINDTIKTVPFECVGDPCQCRYI